MSSRIVVLFILIWAITDRLREVPIFWTSIFKGKWWSRYYTVNSPRWNIFGDAYHLFKNLPVMLVVGLVGWEYGVWAGIYAVAAWGLGQYTGLLFRKED